MTLIITAFAEDAQIQVSDRRLTYTNGAIASDIANKAICVTCHDALFTVAYTGLAKIGNTTIDYLLVNHFTNSHAANKKFDELIKELHNQTAKTFSRFRYLKDKRRISFVFAGFRFAGNRIWPFIAVLSNCEDENLHRLKKINDKFEFYLYLRNEKTMRKIDLLISGTETAITPKINFAIKKIRKRYFDQPPEKRVLVLVNLLRHAANTEKHGKFIGRDIMSTIVSIQKGFVVNYHPENSSPLSYMPHIVAPGFSGTNLWLSTDPQSRPPWVSPHK